MNLLGNTTGAEDNLYGLTWRKFWISFLRMLFSNRWLNPDTKVTILNRKQTERDIFIYETVFENARW